MANEWISVKDRLPDKDGQYLCFESFKFFKSEFYELCYFAKNLYKVDKYAFADEKGKSGFYECDREYGYFELSNITHWMPLPEPPKAEQKLKEMRGDTNANTT